MENTVNTRCDAGFYGTSDYPHSMSPLLDANALYRGFRRSQRGSAWKTQVQMFEMDWLSNIAKLQEALANGTYQPGRASNFILKERGKTRVISGEQIRDRTVKHVLCDDILLPALRPCLIYDNGASLPGKGIEFTRKRLICHLNRYYREYGNDGYILLTDFSKFYDNMWHDTFKRIVFEHVSDPIAEQVIDAILKAERVDVSYMSDDEFRDCMNAVFNSLEHYRIPAALKTGKRFMDKHLNIGDQLAQIAGIAYPMELDSYVKTVRGVKYYARYMDDCYVIHPDKAFLQELQKDMVSVTAGLGIHVNERKTRICRLSDYWRFLQIQYSLTNTGRVIRKMNPKGITRERRKMKKLAHMLDEKHFHDWFFSWYKSYRRYMSRKQRQSIMSLYNRLKEETVCTRSNSQTGQN